MNQRWLLSRRALLGGIGGLGLAALGPRSRARAAAPTRFVVVHVPEGWWTGAQRPVAGAADLGPIFKALMPYRDRVLVLNNLSMASRESGPGGDAHSRGVVHMLTGTEMLPDSTAGGISVDQRIAQAIGNDSKYRSLAFAVRIVFKGLNARPIWSGPGRVVPALQDPWEAYTRLFGDLSPAASTQKPRVDLRRSALDYALVEIAALRDRLPAADRERLDSYHDSLRDMERRLSLTTPASCMPPTLSAALDPKAEPNYPAVGKLQMDLLVSALQCGLTRVASLQWSNSNDQAKYSWLNINTLGHDLSHNTNNVDASGAKKLQVFQWYAQQLAYLLGKLAAIKEGEGSMLDNTAVLWVSEFGNSNGHSAKNLMWLLMGNAAGYFRSGRVLDCGGRATNDVLTSMCNAFGVADESFGNPAFCTGALKEMR
jgi:hypothetical protein